VARINGNRQLIVASAHAIAARVKHRKRGMAAAWHINGGDSGVRHGEIISISGIIKASSWRVNSGDSSGGIGIVAASRENNRHGSAAAAKNIISGGMAGAGARAGGEKRQASAASAYQRQRQPLA